MPAIGDGAADSASRVLPVADGIAAAAELAVTRPPRLGRIRLVAVDGPSGSGKTSLAGPLAQEIARLLGATVIRPRRVAAGVAAASPAGGSSAGGPSSAGLSSAGEPSSAGLSSAAEPSPVQILGRTPPTVTVVSTDLLATWEHPLDWWPLLERCLLAPLAAARSAELPVVQWISGNPRPGGAVLVPIVDVLVVEGVSSGRRAVADRLSALVWVEVPDAAERLERAVARDGAAMRPFLARWQHDEDAHFTADRTRERADVLIAPPADERLN